MVGSGTETSKDRREEAKQLHRHAVKIEYSEVKVTQSCMTFCDTMDYTVHAILQARILEWVAVPFCRESSQPRGRIQVSRIAGRFFTR